MFEPLDVVARDLLFPLYLDLVEARGFTTDVAPYELEDRLRSRSLARAHMVICPSNENDLPPMGLEIDAIRRLEQWVAGRPDLPSTDDFRLPLYNRETDP